MTDRRARFIAVGAVAGVALTIGAAVVMAVAVAWLGVYNVGARFGHSDPFARFLHFTMKNSVKAHAPDGSDFSVDDPRAVQRGGIYFQARCAACHAAPERPVDSSARYFLPKPPHYIDLMRGFSPSEAHWIIMHGVKMTAMPAWPAVERSDEVWSLVAYLASVSTNPSAKASGTQFPKVGIGGKVDIETCMGCHGEDGNGLNGLFPKLAGLSRGYIAKSLRDYRARRRPSGFMYPFSAALDDQQIDQMAAYFSALDRKSTAEASTSADQSIRGRRLASGKSRRSVPCLSCHAPAIAKAADTIPDIVGQSRWYLASQLRLFRDHVRYKTPEAKIMAQHASELTDSDIEALASYFASEAQP